MGIPAGLGVAPAALGSRIRGLVHVGGEWGGLSLGWPHDRKLGLHVPIEPADVIERGNHSITRLGSAVTAEPDGLQTRVDEPNPMEKTLLSQLKTA